MNLAKAAHALRLLADALEEDAPQAADPMAVPVPTKAQARAPRRAKTFPPPLHPPSELDVARARKMLAERGTGT